MKKIYIIYILSFFFIFNQLNDCVAQKTKVMGTVIDSETKEVVPFVSIALKGTKVGTVTNFDGKYNLETTYYSDSLIFSCLGYKRIAKKIIRNKFQIIDVSLEPSSLQLAQINVKANKKAINPALIIFDKIIDNKSKNNIEKLDAYQYETYNKVQFDMNNIADKLKGKRIAKKYSFIYDYVDTSSVNGQPYLPVLIIESLSDYYYRKSPKDEKEFIKASRVSGVENQSIQQFLGTMYIKVNIYDNYIDMFGKGFVSPLANTGKLFYHYFLIDSSFIDNNWCYNIVFQPIIKQENVFHGNFWVADTTFAIKKIELKIDSKVNIDFINNIEISQEFVNVDNKIWMVKKEVLLANFNLLSDSAKMVGVFGRKSTLFKNFVINKPKDDEFYSRTTNVIVSDDAHEKTEQFWDSARHEVLSPREKSIYKMVDTIQNLPIYRTAYDIVTAIVTYYYVWGNFELGPYFSTYSFNDVEGNRFRAGGRTSNKFSTKYMVEAYLAYGTKDERFKHGESFLYLFNPNPRRCISFGYKNDIEQLGQSINAFREDNILSSVLRRSTSNKLSMVEQYKGYYEHEWFQGFSNSLSLLHREVYPMGLPNFTIFTPEGGINIYKTLSTNEVCLKTRLAYDEKFVMGKFERISLGTRHPVVEIYLTAGLKDFWNSPFSYQKIDIDYTHWFNIYPFGWSKYRVQAGKVFGKVPYPLLKLHEGNETYFFDPFSYNMMNYYEFVSDQYVSVYYTHFFDGFFLNKMPVIRRLKLREVAWAQGAIGGLDENNRKLMTFPTTLHALNKPYLECGAGIENIFKILRIDVVWRLTHLDHPNISKFGFRASLQIKF